MSNGYDAILHESNVKYSLLFVCLISHLLTSDQIVYQTIPSLVLTQAVWKSPKCISVNIVISSPTICYKPTVLQPHHMLQTNCSPAPPYATNQLFSSPTICYKPTVLQPHHMLQTNCSPAPPYATDQLF